MHGLCESSRRGAQGQAQDAWMPGFPKTEYLRKDSFDRCKKKNPVGQLFGIAHARNEWTMRENKCNHKIKIERKFI